jgi:putative flippase GtrA
MPLKIRSLFDRKLLKFALVGCVNTVIGMSVMFLLYNAAHASYWFSSAANIIIGSIVSFFLNKYFTFSVHRWSFFMIISFIITIGASYIGGYGMSKLLMNHFLDHFSKRFRENFALFAGECFFTVINYLGQRLVVFREDQNG